ncbi:MAG: cobalt ECF transporter T component CbiQ [Firmicutes bacterium]|nr:cobalt ECF transporter T component CbiQ [Bacillota bacterium]
MEKRMNDQDRRIQLPGWMQEEIAGSNQGVWRRQHSHNFLKKSILQMKRALAEELLTEVYASRDGILQRMNPRLKVVVALALIVFAGFTRSIPVLLGLWSLTLLLMLISSLPVFGLQKRIWGFIPLFTLLMSMPAMFNIIIDGTPLLMIHQSLQSSTWLGLPIPANIYISQQGFVAGIYLFLRVGLSLSFGILLTMTTPVAKLLRSLQIMGMPPVVVMIIEMSYRYLVLLLTLSIEMFEARRLRTVGVLSMHSKRAQFGSSMAALFARSMFLADEVYLGMVARGYTGQAVNAEAQSK